MNKDFKIIISLAKIGQDNSQDLKFVASIVQYPQDINIDSINKTSEILYKHTDFFNKSKFIVFNLDFNLETDSIILQNDNIIITDVNIFNFYSWLTQNKNNYNNLIQLVRKSLIKPKKGKTSNIVIRDNQNHFQEDSMEYQNIIFIFHHITWSNILMLFKLLNITIYGGSSTRRHLLSSVQLSLVKFMQLLNNNLVDPDIIYKSFSEMSTYNSKYNKKIEYFIDRIPETYDEIIESKKIEIGEDLNTYFVFNLVFRMYIKLITFNNNIKNLEFEIELLNKDILDIKDRINNLDSKGYGLTRFNEKLNSNNKLIKSKTDQLKENKLQIEANEIKIQQIINQIYKIDESFFDENRNFIYNNKWKAELEKQDNLEQLNSNASSNLDCQMKNNLDYSSCQPSVQPVMPIGKCSNSGGWGGNTVQKQQQEKEVGVRLKDSQVQQKREYSSKVDYNKIKDLVFKIAFRL